MKLTSTIILLLVFSLCVFPAFSQKPVVEWQKLLGSKNGEYAKSIEPTPDGGFIIAGQTEGPDNADVTGYHGNQFLNDLWVVKLAADRSIQWQKCIGGSFTEAGAYIHNTPDGGFILTGSSSFNGSLDVWVVKLDANGNMTWQKNYGGSQNEYAYSISLASNGDFIIAGITESSNGDVTGYHGNRDAWVIKINSTGTLLWQKCLGGTGEDEAWEAVATPDGGCIMTGFTNSADGNVSGGHGNYDCWAVKLDASGNLQWQKCYGGSNFEQARSVKLASDGGYILAGKTSSNNGDVTGTHANSADVWIVKTDLTGNIQWQKSYGGSRNEEGFFIQNAPDGGYLVCGSSESNDGDLDCNRGIVDMWVFKINSTSALQWQKSIGGASFDEAFCVQPLPDGGAIVAGNTCSREIPGFHLHDVPEGTCADYWIVKLSPPYPVLPAPVVKIDPNSATICAGSTATITASATYAGLTPTYQWKKNGLVVGTSQAFYTASDLVDNDVIVCIVQFTDPCYGNPKEASDTVAVKVIAGSGIPQATIAITTPATCEGSLLAFTATAINAGASPVYQWKLNGNSIGTNNPAFSSNTLKNGDKISCVVMGDPASACNTSPPGVSNTITVNLFPLATLRATITGPAGPVCDGSVANFTAQLVNAGANASIQWKVNGSNAGSNDPAFSGNTFTNGDVITCIVTADPALPCVTSNTAVSNAITLTVLSSAPPSVTIRASGNTFCEDDLVSFIADVTNAGTAPAYHWKVNNLPAGNNAASFSTSHLADGDEVVCEIIPGNNNCFSQPVTSNIIPVAITSRPTVQIIPADTLIALGTQLMLTGIITGNVDSYQWSPSVKLQNAQSLTPLTVTLSDNSSYTLQAIYNNCKSEAKATVRVSQPFLMPNAFSPNGDGRNDLFRIPSYSLVSLESFTVYDRWGNIVFLTRDMQKGWDGTHKGIKLGSDNFVYYIKGKTRKGEVTVKGNVLLVR